MTDEELSEVEEFVDMACREVAATGVRISEYHPTFKPALPLNGDCCCPMQAVARALGLGHSMDAESALDLAWFGEGYDGRSPEWKHHPSYKMGRRFRERVMAGVYR